MTDTPLSPSNADHLLRVCTFAELLISEAASGFELPPGANKEDLEVATAVAKAVRDMLQPIFRALENGGAKTVQGQAIAMQAPVHAAAIMAAVFSFNTSAETAASIAKAHDAMGRKVRQDWSAIFECTKPRKPNVG